MFAAIPELLDKIRMGEESFLELKAVHFQGKRLQGPDRRDLADELAAFANSRGGVCVLPWSASTRSRGSFERFSPTA